MQPLSVKALAFGAVIAAVLGALVTHLVRLNAGSYPVITPLLGLTFTLIAAVELYNGRRVQRLKKDGMGISLTSAAAVAVFAYCAAWTGTLCGGALVGLIGAVSTNLSSAYARQALLGAVIAALGAAVMTAVSVIVERWCHRDDDDEMRPTSGAQSKA